MKSIFHEYSNSFSHSKQQLHDISTPSWFRHCTTQISRKTHALKSSNWFCILNSTRTKTKKDKRLCYSLTRALPHILESPEKSNSIFEMIISYTAFIWHQCVSPINTCQNGLTSGYVRNWWKRSRLVNTCRRFSSKSSVETDSQYTKQTKIRSLKLSGKSYHLK